MRHTFTIFKKELKEILRDRRTLTVMLVIPLLLYPILFAGISSFVQDQEKKADEEGLRIGLADTGEQEGFAVFIESAPGIQQQLVSTDTAAIRSLIESDSLDVVFYFPEGYSSALDSLQAASYRYYFTSTNNEFKTNQINILSSTYQEHLISLKLSQLSVSPRILEPAMAEPINLASEREQFGSIIGGIIPYFFIIFCLIGCMYPAMDLAAGEKERGTLETLLVAPATRMDIYLGKFLAVALSGFISAMAAIIGILFSSRIISNGESDMSSMMEMMNGILEPGSVLSLLGILLPLNAFFAAITLMISIYARSFKEAQSMITPLMIVCIFPAIFGMLPGVELNMTTALIPILNVSLGAKEIIAGTIQPGPLALTYISLIVYAVIALMVSVRFFNDEKNIMRG